MSLRVIPGASANAKWYLARFAGCADPRSRCVEVRPYPETRPYTTSSHHQSQLLNSTFVLVISSLAQHGPILNGGNYAPDGTSRERLSERYYRSISSGRQCRGTLMRQVTPRGFHWQPQKMLVSRVPQHERGEQQLLSLVDVVASDSPFSTGPLECHD